MIRNALVAHARLAQLRDRVGHFFTHPLRNAYMLDAHSRGGIDAGGAGKTDVNARWNDDCTGLVVITVFEVPRQDVSLLDLMIKTGPLPEPILGGILVL